MGTMTSQPAAPLDDLVTALQALRLTHGPDAAAMVADVVSTSWHTAQGAPEVYQSAVSAALLADASQRLRRQSLSAEADTLALAAAVFGRAFRNGLTLASLQVPDYPPSS